MLGEKHDEDPRFELFHKFKLPYDHAEEAQLRLNGTILLYRCEPILIHGVEMAAMPNDYFLTYSTAFRPRELNRVLYSDPELDCRTIKSCYINKQGQVVWLERIPSRVFQQGLNSRNAAVFNLGGTRNLGYQIQTLLRPLSERFVIPWNETWKKLFDREAINSLRLSDELAIEKNNSDELILYRKQRRLGTIEDDYILADEADMDCPWIQAETEKVSLKMRAT